MYWVYLLRCEDGSFYAGITTDPARRLRQHAGQLSGGAKYTAAHPPAAYAALWQAEDRSAASRLEYRLKRLSREEKERLCAGETALLPMP
jgi:putative endonuclease